MITEIKVGRLYKTKVKVLIGMKDYVSKYINYYIITDIQKVHDRTFVKYQQIGGNSGYDNIEILQNAWELCDEQIYNKDKSVQNR